MALNPLRRALLAAACATSALLAACGGGDVVSQFNPSRIVAFGDGYSDLGQRGTRYTINDGSVNVWTQQIASRYGLTLAAAAAGGTSYATVNARVNTKPGAAGDAAAPTVKEQIDTYLAAQAPASSDMVIVQGGVSDVIAEAQAVIAGSSTSAQMLANVGQAGRDLGAQVRRVVQAGGKYVVVAGTYNLGRSPWATSLGQAGLLESASSKFNEELLISIVDLGANVLYVDAALHYNLVVAFPTSYKFTDSTSVVCTSVDAGAGIGTGTGQVNSALCTPSTLLAGADPLLYVFADRVYPTPLAHRTFGDYAFDRLRNRF